MSDSVRIPLDDAHMLHQAFELADRILNQLDQYIIICDLNPSDELLSIFNNFKRVHSILFQHMPPISPRSLEPK